VAWDFGAAVTQVIGGNVGFVIGAGVSCTDFIMGAGVSSVDPVQGQRRRWFRSTGLCEQGAGGSPPQHKF
jgi:hypothetical protein